MPVRKIPKNYRCITGIISARKAVGEAGYEASLERDFLLLLEFDPDVKAFEVQPLRINWRDQSGRRRRYTPDCRVEYIDGLRKPTIFEIKFRRSLWADWNKLRQAYRAAIHATAMEGFRFKILTEKEIRTTYLDCVKFLLPFVRRGTDHASKQLILTAIDKVKVTSPRELMARISDNPAENALLLPSLWYLIGTFQIYSDLTKPLTMDSKIESLS
ncbi:TnsA endonuclease N-terminal domain-containing protein [Tunturibacter psychrotolerans]|uniref:TnsA endonuclease N-terminal domain-containing protein n=1 Tax=Tunturiibacter psychrotolerans TaxID=3069686 RepID=A0AAU7ZRQ0_9BACT